MKSIIKAPTQARSRERMDRVYVALAELLRVKTFDAITIADLSDRANVTTGSIYARFSDKDAILAGLHQRLADVALTCMSDVTEPSRWQSRPTDRVLLGILLRVVAFYSENAHVMRAVVLADIPYAYKNMAAVWQASIDKLTELFVARGSELGESELRERVRFAVRIVSAVMHQREILIDVNVLSGGVTDRQLARQLTHVCAGLLDSSNAVPKLRRSNTITGQSSATSQRVRPVRRNRTIN